MSARPFYFVFFGAHRSAVELSKVSGDRVAYACFINFTPADRPLKLWVMYGHTYRKSMMGNMYGHHI